MTLDASALTIGPWWDIPHVTTNNLEDQTPALDAEEYIESRIRACPKAYFHYMWENRLGR